TPEKRHGGGALDDNFARLRVLEPGPLTLVHDLGRPGLAGIGVGASGAFDRAAHRLANRLVGNDETAAGLEVLYGGAAFALLAGTWFAVTGAVGPLTLDGTPIEPAHPVRAERDGAVLRLGPATRGVRYSLAVRGGIAGEPVLGSRSRDTLAALGPAPLTPNDVLAIGEDTTGPVPAVDLVPVDARTDTVTELMVRPGPRRDWFTNEGWQRMLQTAWVVSPRSDRTGVRLDGATLERRPAAVGRELASEGMTPGAMQVSPDGVPTVLGPDHPVTGGYPVIAVVTDDALDRLAQLRPGDPVRLRLATGRP
ncbi:MAG: 5-oxoprolinase subunit C family protein, partial [Microcella sp.]